MVSCASFPNLPKTSCPTEKPMCIRAPVIGGVKVCQAGGLIADEGLSQSGENVPRLVRDGIRYWRRWCCRRPPGRWTLGVNVSPYSVPVDSQLPRHSPDGKPSQLGLLYCLSPFPLEKSRLPRRGGNCHANHLLPVADSAVVLRLVYLWDQLFRRSCLRFTQGLGNGRRNSGAGGGPFAVSERSRTWRCLLGSNDASLMLYRQPAVQSLQYYHNRSGIAAAFLIGQQLQGVPLELHSVVPGDSPAVLETQDLLQAQLRVQGEKQAQGTVPGPGNAGCIAAGTAPTRPWPPPWWLLRPAGVP